MEGTPDKKAEIPTEEKERTYESYAITLTFKYLKCNSPKGQFRETIQYLTKTLNRSCKYELYPEWRHTTGHIHYHGTIWIVDMIKYFKQTLPTLKSMGFILIKKIDNKDKWDTYCKKEKHIAEGILGIEIPINSVIEYKPVKTKTLKGMSCIEMIESYVEDSKERTDEFKE